MNAFASLLFEGFPLFPCITAPNLKLLLQPLQQEEEYGSASEPYCLYWVLSSVLAGTALTTLREWGLGGVVGRAATLGTA